MATGKVEKAAPRGGATATAALARLSGQMFNKTIDLMIHWVDAGRSNLMQGYASSMALTDFLHSAGLMTDQTYQSINVLSTIMDVSNGIFPSIFGAGALGPTLRTSLDAKGGNDNEEESPESQATTAASTLALAGQIAAAVA